MSILRSYSGLATGQAVKCRVNLTDQVNLATMITSNLTVGQERECKAWQKDVVTVLSMKKSILDNWANSQNL